jgi:hypothetical protein
MSQSERLKPAAAKMQDGSRFYKVERSIGLRRRLLDGRGTTLHFCAIDFNALNRLAPLRNDFPCCDLTKRLTAAGICYGKPQHKYGNIQSHMVLDTSTRQKA